MTPKPHAFLGHVIVGLLLMASAGHAADFEVGKDSIFVIPATLANAGADATYALVDGNKRINARVFVDARAGGAPVRFLHFKQRIPAGSYALVANVAGAAPTVLANDFQVSAPELDAIAAPAILPQATLHVKGKYFSKKPKVLLSFDHKGRRKAMRCTIASAAYYDDPFDDKNTLFAMDVESGASQVQVTLPNYPAGATRLALEVASAAGRSGRMLALTNQPGDLIQWESKGTVSHRTFFIPIWGYLYRAFVCGKTVFDGFENLLTKFAGWVLMTDSKLPSGIFRGRYDVELYAITYMAAYGRAGASNVVASGLLALPTSIESKGVAFHSFQHGTMLMKKEAPTCSLGPEMGVALIFAIVSGHVVIMPDHIGLGAAALGDGMTSVYHPYCQATPNAVGDAFMIPAAKALVTLRQPKVVGRIPFATPLLAGYSEGGYITLALCRELEQNGAAYGVTSVVAAAPLAGPHSLSGITLTRLLDPTNTYPVAYFVPYLLVTYNTVYQRFPTPLGYMAEPYCWTVPPLIDGYHDDDLVEDSMPSNQLPVQAIEPGLVGDLRAARGDFFNDLKTNDLVGAGQTWYPKAKLLLVHGRYDDCVPYENSSFAAQQLRDCGKTNDMRLVALPTTPVINMLYKLPDQILHALYFPNAAGEYWEWVNNNFPTTAK